MPDAITLSVDCHSCRMHGILGNPLGDYPSSMSEIASSEEGATNCSSDISSSGGSSTSSPLPTAHPLAGSTLYAMGPGSVKSADAFQDYFQGLFQDMQAQLQAAAEQHASELAAKAAELDDAREEIGAPLPLTPPAR